MGGFFPSSDSPFVSSPLSLSTWLSAGDSRPPPTSTSHQLRCLPSAVLGSPCARGAAAPFLPLELLLYPGSAARAGRSCRNPSRLSSTAPRVVSHALWRRTLAAHTPNGCSWDAIVDRRRIVILQLISEIRHMCRINGSKFYDSYS